MQVARRGRKRRLALEDEYCKLVLGGVPTGQHAESWASVVTRVTAGESGPAVCRQLAPLRSTRYLPPLERQRIATLRERGTAVREIAGRIGRSPSTVKIKARTSGGRSEGGKVRRGAQQFRNGRFD